MALSEERLQLLLTKHLKASAVEAARRKGVSLGEYVRSLIEADLRQERKARVPFPFGEKPIHTGRKRGSVDHDRF
jgi:hypothetical protein